MRTTIFYIVGMTGLAVAVVFGLCVGVVWTYLTKRRSPREEGEERSRSRQFPPARMLPRTNTPARDGESSDAPTVIGATSMFREVRPQGGRSGSPSESSPREAFAT